MSKKHILVTGGTGAIGSRLVQKIAERDEHDLLVVLDNNSSGHEDNVSKDEKLIRVVGDIADDKTLDEAFSHGITHVYHLAANFANQNSVDNTEKDLRTNGMGTVKMLEHAKKHGVERFLYSSSSCIYMPTEKPFSETGPIQLSTPYAITKMLGEYYTTFYHKFHGVSSVIVRYFSSYGPGDYPGRFRSVIPNFIYRARNGESLTITGTGEETRPFTFVDDTVDGTIAAMEKAPKRELKNFYTHPLAEDDNLVYNIGNEKTITMNELARIINEATGNKAPVEYVPKRDWDVQPHRALDASKARKELGFEAKVGVEEGVKRSIEWFESPDFNTDHIHF
jgi:nucleoside-diphosphate-sugar epimerase